MKVEQFIKEYKNINTENKKQEYIVKHITTQYVPYDEKYDSCLLIAKQTTHEKINSNNGETEIFKVDSVARYMLFVLKLIDLYTDIDIDFKNNMVGDFNQLDCQGLIDGILNTIPESEYVKFTTILDKVLNDIMINERSLAVYIDRLLQKVNFLGSGILPMLERFIQDKDIQTFLQQQIDNLK